MSDKCLCVKNHNPVPTVLYHWHRIPGDKTSETLLVCPNTYANLNSLLRQYEAYGMEPAWEITQRYSVFVRRHARYAWNSRKENPA